MLLRPRYTHGHFEIRDSVSDADTGKIVLVTRFDGWPPVALVCAWAWYLKHRGEYA